MSKYKKLKSELISALLILTVLLGSMCGCSATTRRSLYVSANEKEGDPALYELLLDLPFLSDLENSDNMSLPELDTDSWNLKLVNKENPISRDYPVCISVNEEGYLFDERAVDALDSFLEEGRRQGHLIVITSAYREYDYQARLFENKAASLINEGIDDKEAQKQAAMVVAMPGTSEHQLGLAADIVSENYNALDDGYAETPEYFWLVEHCAEYGFILRYPDNKQSITGIIYEPWHFRYVGIEAASYIMENGLCLEEFLMLC